MSSTFSFVPVKKKLPPPSERSYPCEVCNEIFATWKKWRTHSRKHMAKTVQCPDCGKFFKTQWQVNSHNRLVHATAKLYYKCTLCDKQYPIPSLLSEHYRRHQRDYKIHCEQCGQRFFSRYECDKHERVVHNGERYICFPCNKAFRSRRNLAVHRQEKHDPSFHPAENTCEHCGKTYTNRAVFQKHVRSHSMGPRTFVCDVCGKVLTASASLRNHKQLHTGEKPHVCSTCGKLFNTTSQLKTHLRTHTGERPFACIHCDKRFTQRTPLVIHMRYHTGEKPYSCSICGKEFVSRNLMKMHSKVHGTALADM